jgi:hypothetical protein
MWPKTSPWLTGVLAVALILAAWRLKVVEAELERMEDEVATGRTQSADPGSTEPGAVADGASAATPEQPADGAGEASDISWEWEQAIPPMDS